MGVWERMEWKIGILESGRRKDGIVCVGGDEKGDAVDEDVSAVSVEFGWKRLSTLAVVANAESAGGELSNARSWVASFGYVGSKNGRDIIWE